jgi:hypothetical protein
MAKRNVIWRRSATEWAVRSAIAAALAALGYVSVAHTLAYSQRFTDAVHAHALSPHDGRITALMAQHLAGVDATPADRIEADRLARVALRQDPTVVIAASTLGLDAQARGDTAEARRLFSYAATLSRRDLQTQLWAIEDAVGRGDVKRALHHYDIALRTSRGAPDLLYPVMAAAIVNPDVRAAMAHILAARPPWGGFFIDFVSGNGGDARSTASLLLMLRGAGVPISDDANATMVNTLATHGSMADAWNYYAAIHADVDRRASRDGRFAATGTPSLFDWVLIEEPGTSVSIQRGENGGMLDFAASSGIGGTLLRQVQLLPPGRYILEGHSEGIDQPVESRPYWMLACRDNGRELGRVAMTNSAESNGRFGGVINLPIGCPEQILALIARPSDAVSGMSGQIDQVKLRPISAMDSNR